MRVNDLTIETFGNGLRAREFSAREATEGYLAEIREKNPDIHAYHAVRRDAALAEADAVDARLGKGETLGPLAGVPVALKDNMLMTGEVTTAGSKMLERYRSSYDATVVRKLHEAGAVILGKTNLDEFAMGSSTENSAFGPTLNPYDTTRVPGGSSGGSAAAVAGSMALGAFGSDTGGSIRQPAAFCGVVGLKPTYGAVSRFGLIAMASSLDQIGPFSKTVRDSALLFDAIRGADPFDSTSVDHSYGTFIGQHDHAVKKLRIGIPAEYLGPGLDPAVARGLDAALERLRSLGFPIREISLPHTKHALSVYYIIMPAEVSTNLARLDGVRYPGIPAIQESAETLRDLYFKTRGSGFGRETRRRIFLGTFVLSAGYYDAYYAKAQKVRRLILQDFEEAFKDVDVIAAPATPTPPFKFGEKVSDPLAMYLSDVFTVPANLAGLPAMVLPVSSTEVGKGELPIGFQLIGRHFREEDLFGVGEMYERG